MYLPQGTELNHRYVIESLLGHGGFGITYAAHDQTLKVRVAIKEYLPRQLATRGEGRTQVSVFTGEARQHYDYGLGKFMEEAQSVARFAHHPNVVSARDYFAANGTAYMVMEYVEGVTLKEYLENKGRRISFEEAKGVMMPVMDALREVHQAGMLHRDVSPDNIYITTSAQVKILDFGAARYFAGEQSKSLSVILKPGYAPEEQYRSKGKQGPWTDVYATAATLYKAITGETPTEALERVAEDTLAPPSRLGVAIPPVAEQALLKALAVNAGQRFQTMGDFQQALLGGQPMTTGGQSPARPSPTPAPVAAQPPIQPQGAPLSRRSSPGAVAAAIGGGVIGLALLVGLIWWISTLFPPKTVDNQATALLESGITFLKMGNNERAREVLQQASVLDGQNAKIFFKLGMVCFNLGRYREAAEANKEAARLKSNSFLAHHNLGVAYGKQGLYQEAIPPFKEAVSLRPDNTSARYNLGVAYVLTYRENLAREQYLALEKKDPQTAKKLLNIISGPSAAK